ncbi:CoA pyrophosphatase [Rheinheimera sp.]|uniref:NUDIX hydrolase n=1 Tax=Rheinheimera sp. TaxID=1869214 RepID=UPI00307F3C05
MQWPQFYPRFLLQLPVPHQRLLPAQARASAVLVLLREGAQGLEVLLTERAAHLKHHPGQISFPGGRIEEGESSWQAALREAFEETGVLERNIKALGQLPDYVTGTGFFISPHLALLTKEQPLVLQADEVASAFWLPLALLAAPGALYSELRQFGPVLHRLYFFPYRQKLIWGATAAVLVNLLEQTAA